MNDVDTKLSASDGGQPLYIQLAQTLSERIGRGEYAVGALLPTEAELGASFGVSRYTVRQAIQHLRQQGLVSARKGVGTRVEAQQTATSYTQSIHSLSELLQFASETRLDLSVHEEVVARGALAEMLGCRPGKVWVHTLGHRRADRQPPVCRSEIYIDAAYRTVIETGLSRRTAFWSVIEQAYGETVVELEQQIEAVVLSPAEAAELEAAPGAPALKITRRYFVTGRRLVELSINIHPADRFTYSMTIKRDASSA